GIYVLAGLAIYSVGKLFKLTKREAERKKLKGQVVVITGASQGIGKDIAIELAKEGCKLVLAARSADRLEQLAEELRVTYKAEVLTVPTDVSKNEDAINLIETSLDYFNNIDILINN